MTLETERLILRPLTIADASVAFHGWVGDKEVAEHVSWLPLCSIEETVEWLEEVKWKDDISQMDCFIWGFVLKDSGELIGSGGLIWEEDWQLYQVGYNIMKAHWACGFTTEAMRAVLKFATGELKLKKLAGGHAKENIGSQRVLEKLGFVYDRDDVTPHVDGTKVFDSREYYLELGDL